MDLIEHAARCLAYSHGENWDAEDFTATLNGNEPEEMREGYMDDAKLALNSVHYWELLSVMKKFADSPPDFMDGLGKINQEAQSVLAKITEIENHEL